MPKKFFFPLILVGIIITAGGLFQVSRSRRFQFFGTIVPRVETDQKVVALTFDDAPTPHTVEVIETLKDKQIKATFYVVGKNIELFPEEMKVIMDEGMEIGNHSYSHQRFLLKSPSFVADEIERTNQLIRDSGYTGPITFRPPNGKKLFTLPWYLSRHGITTVMWDVEPDTYAGDRQGQEKSEFLISHTLANTQPGSIILLHPFCDDCSAAREALAIIIDELTRQGYTFVTVSQLLDLRR